MKNLGGVFWGIIFVILTMLTAGGIYLAENARQNNQEEVSEQNEEVKGKEEKREFSLTELAKFNGEGNNPCYVAIKGKVYEITDSSLWKSGEHTTSGGRATCGVDLTDVMASAPHGKSKLDSPKVREIGDIKD